MMQPPSASVNKKRNVQQQRQEDNRRPRSKMSKPESKPPPSELNDGELTLFASGDQEKEVEIHISNSTDRIDIKNETDDEKTCNEDENVLELNSESEQSHDSQQTILLDKFVSVTTTSTLSPSPSPTPALLTPTSPLPRTPSPISSSEDIKTTAIDSPVIVDTPSERVTAPMQRNQHSIVTRLSDEQLNQLDMLIDAIKREDFELFSSLLDKKREFKQNLLNVFVDGYTALHYSLMYRRNLKWCKQLILNGANPNLSTRNGWHPVHLAAYSCDPSTMSYILDCVDDVS